MSVGRPVTRAQLDDGTADLAARVLSALQAIEEWQRWNAQTPQSDLENQQLYSPPYSTDEAFLIKGTIGRLDEIRAYIEGGPVPAGTHDLASDLVRFAGLTVATS